MRCYYSRARVYKVGTWFRINPFSEFLQEVPERF